MAFVVDSASAPTIVNSSVVRTREYLTGNEVEELMATARIPPVRQFVTCGLPQNDVCADASVRALALTDFRHYLALADLRCGGIVWHRSHVPIRSWPLAPAAATLQDRRALRRSAALSAWSVLPATPSTVASYGATRPLGPQTDDGTEELAAMAQYSDAKLRDVLGRHGRTISSISFSPYRESTVSGSRQNPVEAHSQRVDSCAK
jgi:hypothetical protein